mmetsp:Transcript_134273/g.199811  ORF Transcript_134273/g.199811 Transcript_134273/m.199811 type:complete len:160 (+) Transcript_134273:38-517(+)
MHTPLQPVLIACAIVLAAGQDLWEDGVSVLTLSTNGNWSNFTQENEQSMDRRMRAVLRNFNISESVLTESKYEERSGGGIIATFTWSKTLTRGHAALRIGLRPYIVTWLERDGLCAPCEVTIGYAIPDSTTVETSETLQIKTHVVVTVGAITLFTSAWR